LFWTVSKKNGIQQLAWYELREIMESAIEREKRLKDWKRKLRLIENTNPNWGDLDNTII